MFYLTRLIADFILSVVIVAIIALVAEALKIDFGEVWNSVILLVIFFIIFGSCVEAVTRWYEEDKRKAAVLDG